MSKKKLTFEEALKRLNEVVNHLEEGDCPLEESLALFEEGAGLVKTCSKMLEEAEQKVALLKKDAEGSPLEEAFDAEQ